MKKTKVLVMGLLLCLAQPMCSQGFGNLLKGVTTAVKETKKKSQKGNAEVTNQEEQVTNQEEQVTKADDDITLVVSAVGTTTEEATKTALRSAIEQAYGTFVSANTTILNDELVKDEIVTVANGNIKAYKEIACNELADGRISVTLQAMVSISKLVSYAQSKGASTEFAGAAFAMNMKMKELNKKNEMAALENLLVQVKQMLPYAFDRELVIGTPTEVSFQNLSKWNIITFLKATAINCGAIDAVKKNEVEDIVKQGGKPVEDVYNFLNNTSNYYEMPMEIQLKKNENTLPLFQLILNTLESLSLTEEEMEEMRKQNIKFCEYYSAEFQIPGKVGREGWYHSFSFRNSYEDIDNWSVRMRAAILNELSDFIMTDNLGGKSYFTDNNMLSYIEDYPNLNAFTESNVESYSPKYCCYHPNSLSIRHIANEVGLFSPLVLFKYTHITKSYNRNRVLFELYNYYNKERSGAEKNLTLSLSVYIPKDKIMEYSNFSLERKTN